MCNGFCLGISPASQKVPVIPTGQIQWNKTARLEALLGKRSHCLVWTLQLHKPLPQKFWLQGSAIKTYFNISETQVYFYHSKMSVMVRWSVLLLLPACTCLSVKCTKHGSKYSISPDLQQVRIKLH